MIYLFNSGFRPLYTANVLNTLLLPSGVTNEYRYRHTGGESIHISPKHFSKLLGTAQGEDAVVIFVDRFAPGGYIYHPLRFGNLNFVRDDGERLAFGVSLERLIYPKNLEAFNALIKTKLTAFGLPSLTSNNPEETNDGNYAIPADINLVSKEDFQYDQLAFGRIAEHLQDTVAFRDKQGETETAFVRAMLVDDRKQEVHPKDKEGQAVFDIKEKSVYKLRVSYYYPIQKIDRNRISTISVNFGDSLRPLGNDELRLDAYNNTVELPFSAVNDNVNQEDGLSFQYSSQDKKINLLTPSPDKSIVIHINEQRGFLLALIGLLILYVFTDAFKSIDASQLSQTPWVDIFSGIFSNWTKLVGTAVQGIVLYFAFKYIGRDLV